MAEQEFRAEMPTTAARPEAAPTIQPTARRKYMDCRLHPSESHCSLVMAGTEEEVLRAAIEHATGPIHQEKDTPELRDWIRQNLKDVPAGDVCLA